jgi:hypothetical protein
MSGWSLAFAPLLPVWAIIGFALAASATLGIGFMLRARGTAWRVLACLALVLIAASPSLVEQQRQGLRDVAALVVDESPSMNIGDRRQMAADALQEVTARMAQLPGIDLRVIHAGAPDGELSPADEGTRLYTALIRGLADVPAQRIAGAVMISDGEIHDMPPKDRLDFAAPLHVLLTGKPGEADRRLAIADAPKFGLVGKEVQIKLAVEDLPVSAHPGAQARLSISKDGGDPVIHQVNVGEDISIPVAIGHGGPNVVEISVEPGPHELTLDNNRAAFVINGVRDRLKVLLVSGEPHPGERTWRNILKSDPSVDLIHFTILRPPEKQDGTPVRELSLIAFPIRDLFDLKINDFDLIIFDHYRQRGVLPQAYLENIANYVRNGGALLEDSGPAFGTGLSLYRTPVGAVLPAEPTGEVYEQGFIPTVDDLGRRHPVTEDLPGLPADPKSAPSWGRWFRTIGAVPHGGETIMTGYDGHPLLVLDRVGQGRVAQLLSDDMWLWTRGYEGGGPQAELLRRIVYWLMKEPDLEENDLRASVDGGRLDVTRQSLEPDSDPVAVTSPGGTSQNVSLSPQAGGRSTVSLPATESGLYRVSDGKRVALAASGALNPIEMSDVRATADKVKDDADATGGGVFWLGTEGLPEIRRVDPGRSASGPGWLGFRANGDYAVTGVAETPLLPGSLALLLALGFLLLAWIKEGR